jgi:hypothetical protein
MSDHTSEDDYPDMDGWPTAPKTIEAIRDIADHASAKMIDGVLMDVWTAKAITTVYDACETDEQRTKLMELDVVALGRFAWRCVR